MGTPVLSPPKLDDVLEEIPSVDILALFSFLKSITMSLPEEILSEYLLSDERVQMEYIIDRLSGRPGLKHLAALRRQTGSVLPTDPEVLIQTGIRESFEYLENLVESLPDQGFAVTIRNRLEDLRTRFDRVLP